MCVSCYSVKLHSVLKQFEACCACKHAQNKTELLPEIVYYNYDFTLAFGLTIVAVKLLILVFCDNMTTTR